MSSIAASSSSSRPRSMSLVDREAPPSRKSSAKRPLQHPAIRRHLREAPQEQFESDSLAKSREAESGPLGLGLQPLLQGHAKRGSALVSHEVTAARAPLIASWRPRRRASSSSSRAVSSPRPSACRTAISSCSGCEFPGYVDERSRRGGQGEPFAPDRVDLFLVGAGVDDDAGRTAQRRGIGARGAGGPRRECRR